MKPFKQHLQENILELINKSDLADDIKDRHWANHWGYTELPDGNYQHFTGVGAVFSPEYVRKWRINRAHLDNTQDSDFHK